MEDIEMLNVYDMDGLLVARQADEACTMQDVIDVLPALGVAEWGDVDTIEEWDDALGRVISRIVVDGKEVGVIR